MRTSPTRGPWAVRPGSGLVLGLAALLGVSTVAGTSGGDCAGYGHATKSFPQAYLECLQYLNLSRQSLDAFDEQANPPNSDANCLVRCVGLGTRWWDDRDGLSERALLRFFRDPQPTAEKLEQARACAKAGPLAATDHCSAAYRAFRCYSESLGELVTHPRYLAPRPTELRSAVRDCAQVLQVPEESVASYVGQSFLLDERGSKLLHCVVVRLGLYSDTAGMLADRLALLPGTPSASLDTAEAQRCETRVRDFSTDPCLVAAHSAEQCYGREAFGELWPAMVAEYGAPMAPPVPKAPSDGAVEAPGVPNQGVRSRLVFIRPHEDQTTGPTQELPAGTGVPASGHPFEMMMAAKDYDEVTRLLKASSNLGASTEAPLEPSGAEPEPRQPELEGQLDDASSHVIRARSVMCPCYAPPLGPPYYPEFDPYPPNLGPPEPVHFYQPGPHYPGDYPFETPMFHPLVKRMAPYSDDLPVRPMQYPLYDDPFGRVGADVEGFMPELRFAREAFPTKVQLASQNHHPYVASRSTSNQPGDVPSAAVVESKKDAAPGEDAVVEPLVAQQSRSKSTAKTSAVQSVVEKEQELPGKGSPVLSDVAPEQDGNEELAPADQGVEQEQELPGKGSPVLSDVAPEQDGNEELTPTDQEQDSGTGTPESNDGASEQDANEDVTPADQGVEKEQELGQGSPVLNDGGSNEEFTPAEQLVEEEEDPGTGTLDVNESAPEQGSNEELTPAEQVVQETETPKEDGSEPESSAANPLIESVSDLTKSETPEQGGSALAAAQPAAPLDTTPAEVPKADSPAAETTPEPTTTKLESVPGNPTAVEDAASLGSADPAASKVAPQPAAPQPAAPQPAAPQPAVPLQTAVRPKRRGPMGVMEIIKTLAKASLISA